MSASLGGLQSIDVIKALGICDESGHVQACGYEEHEACFCIMLPTNLRDAIDPIIRAAVDEALAAERNRWATAIGEGVRLSQKRDRA